MKTIRLLLTVAVALAIQMALARYAVGGRWVFDLVLVGVVYAALFWGPGAGMVAGTLGGLMQDALSGGVVGVGGLAKTVVGFGVGLVGAQVVVARPFARAGVVAGATIVHRLIVIGVSSITDQHWLGVSSTAILMETGLNSAAGLTAFLLADMVPGAVRQTRESRRSSLSRRQW